MRVKSIFATLLLLTVACNTNSVGTDESYVKTYGNPASPALTVSVAPIDSDILKKISVKISHTLSPAFSVQPYALNKNHVKGFVVFAPKIRHASKNGVMHKTYAWSLEPLDTGEFRLRLPELNYALLAKNGITTGETYTIKLDTIPINIVAKTTDRTPIPDIFNLLKPKFKYVYVLYSFVLALIAAWICRRLLRYLKTVSAPTEPEQSPLEYVLCEIGALEKRVQSTDTNGTDVYMRLNYLFKYFLERHLKIILPGETPEEGLKRIRANDGETSENSKMVAEFCDISDLVKFAGFEIQNTMSINAIHQVKRLIAEHTK